MTTPDRSALSRAVADGLGTAFLLAAVVGSGIMGERLSGGNVAIALLANSLATGAALVALIATFGPLSGAHFNPVVSVAQMLLGRLTGRACAIYIAAQLLGAIIGVAAANVMFGEPVFAWSGHARTGGAQWLSEAIATFGLVQVVLHVAASKPGAVPIAVGAYITAAYWFTSSTSFANPAVTVARTLTDTFAGIRPIDAPAFAVVQFLAAGLSVWAFRAWTDDVE
jgi:glycerol uptake facilitator-like aquaporin